uniref:Uncharacterized protein n=1 Tax=Moniliophthora roreri TaxID=221103 RepID=A0A0W0FE98_MONRR
MAKKNNNFKAQRGRRSWAQGKKLLVLLKHEKIFYKNRTYYDLTTHDFMDMFSFDLRYNAMPVARVDYCPKPIEDYPVDQQQAEEDRHTKITKNTRYMDDCCLARNRFLTKKTDSKLIGNVLEAMSELTRVLPHRHVTSSIHMYQHLYYDLKIKPEFDAFWEHHVKIHPDMDWISEMNHFMVRHLKTETEEVKAVIKNAVDKEYDKAMKEYRQIGQWKSSAEKYKFHWKKAERVVPTLCDVIAKHLGVGVLLTTFGLMSNGEIDDDVEDLEDQDPDSGSSRLLNLAESSSFASTIATIVAPITTTPHPTAAAPVTAVATSTTVALPSMTNPSAASSSASPSNPITVNDHDAPLNPSNPMALAGLNQDKQAAFDFDLFQMPYQDIPNEDFHRTLEQQRIPQDIEKELAASNIHTPINTGLQTGSKDTVPHDATPTTPASSASPSPLADLHSDTSNQLPQAHAFPEPPAVVGDGKENDGMLTLAAKKKMALKRKSDTEKQAAEADEEKSRRLLKCPRKGKGDSQPEVAASANTKSKRAKPPPPLQAKSSHNTTLLAHLAGYEAPTKGKRG